MIAARRDAGDEGEGVVPIANLTHFPGVGGLGSFILQPFVFLTPAAPLFVNQAEGEGVPLLHLRDGLPAKGYSQLFSVLDYLLGETVAG